MSLTRFLEAFRRLLLSCFFFFFGSWDTSTLKYSSCLVQDGSRTEFELALLICPCWHLMVWQAGALSCPHGAPTVPSRSLCLRLSCLKPLSLHIYTLFNANQLRKLFFCLIFSTLDIHTVSQRDAQQLACLFCQPALFIKAWASHGCPSLKWSSRK